MKAFTIVLMLASVAAQAQQVYNAEPLNEHEAGQMKGWRLYDIAIDNSTGHVVSKHVVDDVPKFKELVDCLREQRKFPMMRSKDKLLGRVCGHDTKGDSK
jgi:hypothetical protein